MKFGGVGSGLRGRVVAHWAADQQAPGSILALAPALEHVSSFHVIVSDGSIGPINPNCAQKRPTTIFIHSSVRFS